MSLLDQLSSLCIQSAAKNYQPSFLSLNLDNPSSNIPNFSKTQLIDQRNGQTSSEMKKSQVPNSEQKMIKLFDDEQLQSTWKLIKTDKKSNSKPNFETSQSYNLSQFMIDHNQKNSQAILTKFTKIFYLFNTKLRKMNYEFFVKFEKYLEAIQKQKAQKEEEMKKMKALIIEKGFHKLTQTLKIIDLKYFQPQSQQLSVQNAQQKKNQAFNKIKSKFFIRKKLSWIPKIVQKNIYRLFFIRFQHQNKIAIKIELFNALLDSILKKKHHEDFQTFFISLKNSVDLQKQTPIDRHDWIKNTLNLIPIKESFPLGLFLPKAVNTYFSEETQLSFENYSPQNIPLRLHNLKYHEEQTNLNDCIDNGHLMMNQLKNNLSFKQELENLTISNINRTSNTSVNSSFLVYDNLILNQQNIQEKQGFASSRAITMRKQSRKSDDIPFMNENLLKHPKNSRKSLVITKRKESANDMLSYAQVMFNSEKQKLFFELKKPKYTTTSTSKIAGQKQPSNTDKEVIKRMLDELNKKFACDDKVIKISLSNKKQNSNAKKEKNESSGKNFEKKKIKSEFAPINYFNEKSNKKQAQNKSARKEGYRIDLTDRNKEDQKLNYEENKKKNKAKSSENCFMSVTLNKTVSNLQNSSKAKFDHGKLPEHRAKQSYSEMSKKNLDRKCISQSSEQSEICKILSKYRSKKPSIPQCCMKIDLVTSKVNKVLNMANMAQKSSKGRNKIFFNNTLEQTEDYKFQLGSNDSINEPNLEAQKTFQKPSNDSEKIKRNSMNHLSSLTDSVLGGYVSILPSNIYFEENQEENDCLPYQSQKPEAVNTSLDASECFFTGSKARLYSNNMNSSMNKKRASFERNLEEWDIMFEKQKKKFLKNQNNTQNKKSSLNEEVISEIKNKIQQCLILNQKDTNASKGPYLQLKKINPPNRHLQEKSAVMSSNNTVKILSSSSSNRSSINKLYTANKLAKKIQN